MFPLSNINNLVSKYFHDFLFLTNFFPQEAEAEDFKAQKKEMEDIVQPIIAKLYQGQGGAPPGGEEEEDIDKDELQEL